MVTPPPSPMLASLRKGGRVGERSGRRGSAYRGQRDRVRLTLREGKNREVEGCSGQSVSGLARGGFSTVRWRSAFVRADANLSRWRSRPFEVGLGSRKGSDSPERTPGLPRPLVRPTTRRDALRERSADRRQVTDHRTVILSALAREPPDRASEPRRESAHGAGARAPGRHIHPCSDRLAGRGDRGRSP
jgi:hypothetical protein